MIREMTSILRFVEFRIVVVYLLAHFQIYTQCCTSVSFCWDVLHTVERSSVG